MPEQIAALYQQYKKNCDDECNPPWNQAEYNDQINDKKHNITYRLGAAMDGCRAGCVCICEGLGADADRDVGYGKCCGKNQEQRNDCDRCCDRKEFRQTQSGYSVEVQILRIAERSEHASEIGSNCLHDDRVDHMLRKIAFPQYKYGKRNECDQGYIVGNEHTGKEADHDQKTDQSA